MLVGFQALAQQYGIRLVQPLKVRSVIGTTSKSTEQGYQIENHYLPLG